jgi:hypothetical protein
MPLLLQARPGAQSLHGHGVMVEGPGQGPCGCWGLCIGTSAAIPTASRSVALGSGRLAEHAAFWNTFCPSSANARLPWTPLQNTQIIDSVALLDMLVSFFQAVTGESGLYLLMRLSRRRAWIPRHLQPGAYAHNNIARLPIN